jgi:hypothetical protein
MLESVSKWRNPTPIFAANAPEGWRAVYQVGDEHVVLPVAFWVVQRCEHGFLGNPMVVPPSGDALEARHVEFAGRTSSFVAIVPPGADVESIVSTRRRDLRSVAQA